jgi:hypothetical protein
MDAWSMSCPISHISVCCYRALVARTSVRRRRSMPGQIRPPAARSANARRPAPEPGQGTQARQHADAPQPAGRSVDGRFGRFETGPRPGDRAGRRLAIPPP